mgnify:CR=1 FL=1
MNATIHLAGIRTATDIDHPWVVAYDEDGNEVSLFFPTEDYLGRLVRSSRDRRILMIEILEQLLYEVREIDNKDVD